ncbi:MAG TPA: aminotransferase class IV [Bryobacteraceae bacterium]|nr:aminotransferase class IV [Bryobacteraceae bacterium]
MPEQPVVYIRGKLVPAPEAQVSIYDLGVVQGATVTDLLRTFQHVPYRLEEHVRRFYESCKYARICPPVRPEEALEIIRELVDRNAALEHRELAVVLFITPGENLIYAGSSASGVALQPTFCIHSFPLPLGLFRPLYVEGIHLVTPPTRHVPPQCVDPKIKNRSRLHFWLAEQEAHLVDPEAMPLLLDLDGNLTETSGGNVLLAKNGVVLSPPPRNILQGVSRKVVLELCAQLGLAVHERDLQLHDILTADEAFVTTTPYCIAPVTRCNGIPVGDGRPGPLFERILAAWSQEVGLDIRCQILESPE